MSRLETLKQYCQFYGPKQNVPEFTRKCHRIQTTEQTLSKIDAQLSKLNEAKKNLEQSLYNQVKSIAPLVVPRVGDLVVDCKINGIPQFDKSSYFANNGNENKADWPFLGRITAIDWTSRQVTFNCFRLSPDMKLGFGSNLTFTCSIDDCKFQIAHETLVKLKMFD